MPESLEVIQVSSQGRDLLVSQVNALRVVATDPATGEVVWTYDREPVREQPYLRPPQPTVVCPVIWLPAGAVVLRYHDELHAVDGASGRLLYRQEWANRRFCPAATPDSGIVIVTHWGDVLEKLGPDGERVWERAFTEYGPAITMPTVVFPSGDIVVRTRHHLLSFAPDGELNWVSNHSLEPERSE